ncbi:MAG: hypothetical protein QNJ32_23285 [Xenococcaceae cyanobacterium MO_167.B27]|nr:hypothetical protein [Xenococcaceae cyanobacterium MO_167.B27]
MLSWILLLAIAVILIMLLSAIAFCSEHDQIEQCPKKCDRSPL